MKRIYLVDSENVGDIWVPLLVASQPDEEVIVFYTQKSPHMNYENVRLLKETEKEAEFIKCFEAPCHPYLFVCAEMRALLSCSGITKGIDDG